MVELRKYEPRLSEGMGWWSRGDGSKIIQGGGEDSRDEQMVFHVRLTQVHSEPQECYEAVELTISSYMSIVTIGKRLPAELEDLVMDFASPLPIQLLTLISTRIPTRCESDTRTRQPPLFQGSDT